MDPEIHGPTRMCVAARRPRGARTRVKAFKENVNAEKVSGADLEKS
jgi:hypothetical protein